MSPEFWRRTVGLAPFTVTVEEVPAKRGVLYLRWLVEGNWKRKSLKAKLRDEKGRIRRDVEADALRRAEEQYEILSGKRLAPGVQRAPLTLAGTWALITDRSVGAHPIDTPHRREIERALRSAIRILGGEMPWAMMNRTRFRQIARTRVDEIRATGKEGMRGAEVTVDRLLAVASWLRAEEHIPDSAGFAGEQWQGELVAYVEQLRGRKLEVSRPRYTGDELRAILSKATAVDPRFALATEIGYGLRPGQVLRARRRDVELTASEHGLVRIIGKGKKGGTVVLLTLGQSVALQAAMLGYLRDLEKAYQRGTIADYALFPAGKFRQGVAILERSDVPVNRRTFLAWWHEAEALAGVPLVRGRGPYGGRRNTVDEAKKRKASREALQSLGGWADAQIPDRIYADQQLEAGAEEARTLRAQIRGEIDP